MFEENYIEITQNHSIGSIKQQNSTKLCQLYSHKKSQKGIIHIAWCKRGIWNHVSVIHCKILLLCNIFSLHTWGETEELHILQGVLQGDTLAPHLLIIVLDYAMRKASGLTSGPGLNPRCPHVRRKFHPGHKCHSPQCRGPLSLYQALPW